MSAFSAAFTNCARRNWSPTVGSNSLGSSLSMCPNCASPVVDLLETLATSDIELTHAGMTPAMLYSRIAKTKPWYRTHDQSIYVLKLDPDINPEYFKDSAHSLIELGAISEYQYAEKDGQPVLIIELSRAISAVCSDEE